MLINYERCLSEIFLRTHGDFQNTLFESSVSEIFLMRDQLIDKISNENISETF